MAKNTSRFMLERLHGWGVRKIFAYPGDGINSFLAAFNEIQGTEHEIEFLQTRHEEIAAFAASAHAKFTGELGVCMATSGGGANHLINGLYDAKLDHQPVVAIVGQQKRMSLGGHFQQELDTQSLYKDVASEFVHYCMAPAQAARLVDHAVRTAVTRRTVCAIIVPDDVGEAEHQDPPRMHGVTYSGEGSRCRGSSRRTRTCAAPPGC